MTVAEYKRSWFLARRAELHARGLKDADIARQMGLQRAYFSQVVGGANVGDGFIDRMCSAFAHYKARITQDDRDDALRKALGGLE